MKRKAHGAEEPRHMQKYVEVTSTALRNDSPSQVINQRFLGEWQKSLEKYAYPVLGDMSVGTITSADIAAALEPSYFAFPAMLSLHSG